MLLEVFRSQVAVAQFTPQAKYEFGFVTDNFETLERRLNVSLSGVKGKIDLPVKKQRNQSFYII